MKDQFTPRIRFNWGFWDAMNDKAQRRAKDELWITRHHDKSYARGYSAGKQWTDPNVQSSEPAWKESRA